MTLFIFIGSVLESRYSGFIILIVFFISGVGSASYILSPMSGMDVDQIIVGASGSIYGLLGMFLVEQVIIPRYRLCRIISLLFLLIIIVMLCFEPLLFPSNSTAGHV